MFCIVGIALTFAIGVWNLVLSYRTTRKTGYINTVTNQRVKWIEQLRQDIATFAGLTYTWSFSQAEGKPQEFEMLRDVDRLRYVIRLRLTPDGTHDRKIKALVAKIPELTHTVNQAELKDALDELVVTSQSLLKEEWQKVTLALAQMMRSPR
jgi:hypothetical protein